MSFSDEALKWLRDYIFEISYCTCKDNGALCEGCNLGKQFPALLARLEAAEAVIKAQQRYDEGFGLDEDMDYSAWGGLDLAKRDWIKAGGKY